MDLAAERQAVLEAFAAERQLILDWGEAQRREAENFFRSEREAVLVALDEQRHRLVVDLGELIAQIAAVGMVAFFVLSFVWCVSPVRGPRP